jgi:hypothetical protein
MEFRRTKNVDTRVVFPIQKTDGTFITGATGLDSEYALLGAHGGAAPTWTDCTHEATEIGTTGMYYLDVSAAEINDDYAAIQIKSTSTGAITQVLLFNLTNQPADVINWKGSAAAALTGDPYAEAAAVHAHVNTIDGHITADYGSTEKTCVDLLDDANGLVNIHDTVDDVHTDVGTAIADVAATHVHAAGGETQATAAAASLANGGFTDLLIDDLHTDVADVHTDVGSAITDIAAVHVHAGTIEADTNELQTDWVNAGRLDAILDAAAADASAAHVAVDLVHTHVEDCATATVLGDVHTDVGTAITNLGTVDTVVDGIETHVHAVDGHIGADYGATEKAAIDLLDDAAGGLLDIHTDVGDVHTDVGTAITNIGDVHTDVGTAITKIDAVDDYVDTEVAAILAAVDTEVGAIKEKTDTIGAVTVTVTSPVASDGVTVTTYRGDDYKQHEGREIRWLIATPDLTPAIVTLHVGSLDIVCTLVDGGLATQSVYAELTAIQTVTLLEARGLYSVTAAMADADVRTLVVGEWKSEIRVV